ncbi:leucine-rich repeat protein [Eggerthellaceae bacterium zg-893]|nr:leucine-rich repeat protein [Eggerthellaceae bacterium zg-893]
MKELLQLASNNELAHEFGKWYSPDKSEHSDHADQAKGGLWSAAQIEHLHKIDRERDAVRDRAQSFDAARESEEREWADGAGSVWRYTVLDECAVRLLTCDSTAADLLVPSAVEGKPVVALANRACSGLREARAAVLPDSVLSLGSGVFYNCSNLRRVVLPSRMASFDPGWFRGCSHLEELTLPGLLEEITPSVFEAPSLKTLVVGAGTTCAAPGAFGKSRLEALSVDPENAFLETDGLALYTKGRKALIGLAVHQDEYRIAPGCRIICSKAFNRHSTLARVDLPDSIASIGSYAFAHTAIREFTAPAQLRDVRERAFFNCRKLERVLLGDGLEYVGANAFSDTALAHLRFPASLKAMNHPVAEGTNIRFTASDQAISIEEGGVLSLDAHGGLYRRCADGLHLERVMDPDATTLVVAGGTVAIEPQAAFNHRCLETVVLPAGLVTIGEAAFKGCKSLRSVNLPEGLVSIDEEAFLDSNIEALHLPASLAHIGSMALVTQGVHSGRAAQSLRDVAVSKDNRRFSVESGMLLEHKDDGSLAVIAFTDTEEDVYIPDAVKSIAPYAFASSRAMRRLRVLNGISDVGIRAFSVEGLIETIRIDLVEPIGGHDHFTIRFPDTDRGRHQQYVAFTSAAGLELPNLFENYDAAIMNASSFNLALKDEGMGLYEQAKLMMGRLKDPLFMTPANRQMITRAIEDHLVDICKALSRCGDRLALDDLANLGFLTEENIASVIDRIASVRDAAMTAHLLEMRRRWFGQCDEALDFSL